MEDFRDYGTENCLRCALGRGKEVGGKGGESGRGGSGRRVVPANYVIFNLNHFYVP